MRNATGFLLALKLFDKELLALALPVLSGFPTPGIVVLIAPRGGGEANRLRACVSLLPTAPTGRTIVAIRVGGLPAVVGLVSDEVFECSSSSVLLPRVGKSETRVGRASSTGMSAGRTAACA